MNSENKTNKGEKGTEVKTVPPVSPRVVTYKKATTLKKTQAPTVTVGRVKKAQTVAEPTQNSKTNSTQAPKQAFTARGTVVEEKKAPSAPKVQNNPLKKHKKKRITQGVKPIKVIIGAVILIALVIGGVIFGLYSSGRRYETVKFTDVVSDAKYNIVFIGKVDEKGVPLSGTMTYEDGSKATIGRSENNLVRIEYENGWIYEGDFESFHRNGYGTLTMSNGDVYKGNFFYDRMWGNGEYRYANGDVYKGEFENNVKCGDGVYEFAVGNRYEGKFENNLRNGEGVFTYADGSVYEGAFVNDIKNDDNAKMTIITENGETDIYVGSFVNDLREGTGMYTFACGDTYEGEFRGNYISGHGIYTWVSGRTYEGEFLNGAIVKDNTIYP